MNNDEDIDIVQISTNWNDKPNVKPKGLNKIVKPKIIKPKPKINEKKGK